MKQIRDYLKTMYNLVKLLLNDTKAIVYWKDNIGIFVLATIIYTTLFLLVWFDHDPKVSRNMAHMSTVFWVITTMYICWCSKWSKAKQ